MSFTAEIDSDQWSKFTITKMPASQGTFIQKLPHQHGAGNYAWGGPTNNKVNLC